MTLGAHRLGDRTLGDGTGDSGVTGLSGIVHDATATHTIEGELAVVLARILTATATHTIEGLLTVLASFAHLATATHTIAGLLRVSIPVVEGRKRVVLVGPTGSTLGDLDGAVVSGPRYPLNGWESWSFTLPVENPKAHLVLDERIREAQVWRGDVLLSWGPMARPQVRDGQVVVQGYGARWFLGRRTVGKAGRDDQLCNSGFELGMACWNFLKGAYFLDYAPLQDGDARVYRPGLDGEQALELNIDLQPWASPTGGSGATVTKVHVVVSGDTLWDLAATYYGSGTQWFRIYNENQALIQAGAVAAGLWNPYDPGHWIFPGQNLTVPGITVEEVVTAPPDDNIRWGDVFAYQHITVNGGVRGLTATLVAWVYVRSDLFTGWGWNRQGVVLDRLRTDWATNNWWQTTFGSAGNTWGGARAFYTDVVESSSSRMDEGHAMDTWVRHETTIKVPPGVTEVLHARLCGVEGRVYWDRASLTFDSAFEQFDTDQATIVGELVEHAQDPAFDKNDVNITSETPATGVRRTLVALHSEHGNIWNLAHDFTEYRDGLDIGMRYTPSQRILTTHYPRKGTEHLNLHLQLGRNVAGFVWVFDGEAAASSVILLGTGDGSDREEASAIDPSAFADGLVLETVIAVGPDTPVELLPELADEHLAVVRNPEVVTVVTYPHDPARPERNLIGRLWEGDTVPTTLRKGRRLDPDTGEVVGWQFEVDDTYRVVELELLANDAMRLVLNRRSQA